MSTPKPDVGFSLLESILDKTERAAHTVISNRAIQTAVGVATRMVFCFALGLFVLFGLKLMVFLGNTQDNNGFAAFAGGFVWFFASVIAMVKYLVQE